MAFSDEEILEDILDASARGAPEKFKLDGFGLYTPSTLRKEENRQYRKNPLNRLRRRAWLKWRYATDPAFKAEADRRAAAYAKSSKGRAQSRKRRKAKWLETSEDKKDMQRAKWREYQKAYRQTHPANRDAEAAKRRFRSTEKQLLKYLQLYLTFNPAEAKRQHVIALIQLFQP